jgi:hypothetical protein
VKFTFRSVFSRGKEKTMKKFFILLIITFLFLVTVSIIIAQRQNNGQSSELSIGQVITGRPGRPMVSWIPKDQQNTAKNEAGELSVRGYAASSREILFLYSFKANQATSLQFEAISQNEATDEQITINQPKLLGKKGDFEIGIIKITPSDIPGQLISIKATSPGQTTTVWQVTPIQQVDSISNFGAIAYHYLPPSTSGINVQFGSGGSETYPNTLKISLSTSTLKETLPDYYKLGVDFNLVTIDANEFSKLNAPITSNPNSGSNSGGYSATVAPTRIPDTESNPAN